MTVAAIILASCAGLALLLAVSWHGTLELRKQRAKELDSALGAVSRAFTEMVVPVQYPERAPAAEPQATAQQPPMTVSPYARPAWGDPVVGDEEFEFDDPTDLRQPYDQVDGELMQVARLHAIYTDPVPEAEGTPSGNGRVATFGVGENPLSDIGETPAWLDDEGADGR